MVTEGAGHVAGDVTTTMDWEGKGAAARVGRGFFYFYYYYRSLPDPGAVRVWYISMW